MNMIHKTIQVTTEPGGRYIIIKFVGDLVESDVEQFKKDLESATNALIETQFGVLMNLNKKNKKTPVAMKFFHPMIMISAEKPKQSWMKFPHIEVAIQKEHANKVIQ